jgi:O-antigen/teichoic acid export membrane protein
VDPHDGRSVEGVNSEPGTLDDRSAPDGIVRNTTFALAVQITVSAFSAALTLFLVRKLGPAGYGIFALAVAIGVLCALLAELGISPATARFVAERRGDRNAMASVVAAALRLKLPLTAVIAFGLLLLSGPLAQAYGHDSLAWPLRALAVGLFGQGLASLLGGTFVAQGRVALNLRLVFAGGVTELCTTVALVLLGAGSTGAAFGRAAGWTVAGAFAVVLAIRSFGRRAVGVRAVESGRAREIVRYAGVLAVVDAAVVLFEQIDAILIGAFLGAASVGVFQAPMRLTTFLLYPGYAVASGVAPRLSHGVHHRAEASALRLAYRLIVLFQAALLAPVVVWATPIADLLFGGEFSESADVLRWLAPFVFLSGLAPLVSLGANYLGLARRRAPIAIAAVAVNIGLDLVLLPTIGVVGAAIATSAAYAIYVPAHIWLCWRALDLELRDTVVPVIRALAAATTMAATLLAFGTAELSLWQWLGGAVAGTAVYVATLSLTGELTRGDLRAARRLAPAFRGGR